MMRRSISLIFAALLAAVGMHAQGPVVAELWPGGAPGSNGLSGAEEVRSADHIRNISRPTLTVFKSAKPGSKAVICCPGGCYLWEAVQSEGAGFAPFFNHMDVTFIVLKYRLPNGHHDIPLTDALEAIRTVRRHADEWNVDPSCVGIMGCSAGGHLASTAACLYTEDSRPDFQILVYPVISMDDAITHRLSRQLLLGNNPSPELLERYSTDRQVPSDAPRAFIMACSDDSGVPVENTLRYYCALLEKKIPASLHIYPSGGHGWGATDRMPFKMQWTAELEKWIHSF